MPAKTGATGDAGSIPGWERSPGGGNDNHSSILAWVIPWDWCFWIVLLEKTLESPLDCKEIKSVNPKGNQPWVFIGRTDAEALIFWPPDVKNWLTGKDPDAGQDWRQEKKEKTEDEMAGWHDQVNGHEFEQTLGVGDGQGSLVCSSLWGCTESDMMERLNWAELNCPRDRGAWRATVHGVTNSWTQLSTHNSLIILANYQEKAMATHSSTLAWKIPWTEEPHMRSPWGSEKSDMTERLHFHFSLSCIREGNGNPLQCSRLENPRDGWAWWAAIYGAAQSWTQLKWLGSSSSSSSKLSNLRRV